MNTIVGVCPLRALYKYKREYINHKKNLHSLNKNSSILNISKLDKTCYEDVKAIHKNNVKYKNISI